ncbi:MAG: hypothetical protein LRY52_01110 [Sulfurospirillum cavolei]|nr:hypothetical protein [Sulfurospirillum cavolei]
MVLGKCPYCGGSVISQKLTIQGQKVNLYACEHAKKERDINDDYVFSSEATCRFRVYSNTFLRWNKRSLSEYEMKQLLKEGQIAVRLHGRKGTGEYFKYVITDPEYGVSIVWDSEVA